MKVHSRNEAEREVARADVNGRRSKKHRIACYRAGASKCSKYAPNARPRGPNRPMQITERPRPHSYNQWSLSRDRCRNGWRSRIYIYISFFFWAQSNSRVPRDVFSSLCERDTRTESASFRSNAEMSDTRIYLPFDVNAESCIGDTLIYI